MDISIQTGVLTHRLGIEKAYELIAKTGFTALDWNIDNALKASDLRNAPELKGLCVFERPLEEIIEHYTEELEIMKKNNLTISQAHAPFPPYVYGRPEVLDYCIGIYKKMVLFCEAIGCKNLIIHSIVHHPSFTGVSVEDVRQLNMKMYTSLIDELKQTNVTVCLENLFFGMNGKIYEGTCSDPHEAVAYIDELNEMAGREAFGLCVDTGHLNLLGKRCPLYMPIVGKRVKALHIHDNDGSLDRHLAPYTGTFNWFEFVQSLKDIGYDHDLSFETFAQVAVGRLDEELIPEFLRHIYEIGDYFRKKITE